MTSTTRLIGNQKIVEAEWPAGRTCKIAIVGDAPDTDDAQYGAPFCGESGAGRVLDWLLKNVGIERSECLVTNVFRYKPRLGEIKDFFVKKKATETGSPLPAHPELGFVAPDLEAELTRLYDELREARPNVVIALGPTALWALTYQHKITTYRGTFIPSEPLGDAKVIGTYHPATIIRNWAFAPIAGMDLAKAKRDSAWPEIRHIEREIWIEPTLGDMEEFYERHIVGAEMLTYDIETAYEQITCVGFSPDEGHSLVVPFVDKRRPGWNYWPDLQSELAAWQFVRRCILLPVRKLAHNAMYDIQWLVRDGCPPSGTLEDTMLLHHALQPELQKSLGVLASLYCNERAWKSMANFKMTENKRDA